VKTANIVQSAKQQVETAKQIALTAKQKVQTAKHIQFTKKMARNYKWADSIIRASPNFM
jgi:UDP-N-acetylglucosamine:LPS N-acetylglucosamine transferase